MIYLPEHCSLGAAVLDKNDSTHFGGFFLLFSWAGAEWRALAVVYVLSTFA